MTKNQNQKKFLTIIINSIKGLWNSLIYGINNAPKALYLIVGVLTISMDSL